MLYTHDGKSQFYINPSTIELGDGIEATTWKAEDYQEFYNFEIHFPSELVKEDFRYDSGGYFMNDFADYIDCINTVIMKDGLLIISGLKTKA